MKMYGIVWDDELIEPKFFSSEEKMHTYLRDFYCEVEEPLEELLLYSNDYGFRHFEEIVIDKGLDNLRCLD